MRIFNRLTLCMMLAVNGGPLLGYHPSGQPQPKPEKMGGNGMEIERSMRLTTV
jgi:hypothetical protein